MTRREQVIFLSSAFQTPDVPPLLTQKQQIGGVVGCDGVERSVVGPIGPHRNYVKFMKMTCCSMNI